MTLTTFTLRPRGGKEPEWTLQEDVEVARRHKSGLSAQEIAEHTNNRTTQAIRLRLGTLRKRGMIQ